MTLLLSIMLMAATDLSWWWLIVVIPVWIFHLLAHQ
mgnify:CR=1 FL=1